MSFLQIFLSTRWAILLNLHVEMFRVNKYPTRLSYHIWFKGCELIIIIIIIIKFVLLSSLTCDSVEDILQVLIVYAAECLELDFALLFPERHVLLRILPVLVVLATSSEKDSESLNKRVKMNRLITIFKVCIILDSFPFETKLLEINILYLFVCRMIQWYLHSQIFIFHQLQSWRSSLCTSQNSLHKPAC